MSELSLHRLRRGRRRWSLSSRSRNGHATAVTESLHRESRDAVRTRALGFRFTRLAIAAVLAVAGGVSGGCEKVDDAREIFLPEPETAREGYEQGLILFGLDSTALGQDWRTAGRTALEAPADIPTPYQEAGYLSTDHPGALGFRFFARRGWRIAVEVTIESETETKLFVEAFRAPRDSDDPPLLVAAAEDTARSLVFEAHRDSDYIIRLQPELLRGGQYTVAVRAAPSLAFPVQGGKNYDVGSVFGDPRDGGVRDHHGIDIFARRGTPALAAGDGRVRRVETTPVGGKVVWLDLDSGARAYYAHLDSQLVRNGQVLRAGEPVGLVGNTGNARTTPPHLHFGIYQRGPINPYDFVAYQDTLPDRIAADPALISTSNGWARVSVSGATLRAGPGSSGARIGQLERDAAVRVLAASSNAYRVQLPGGEAGFIAAVQVEPAVDAIELRDPVASALVLSSPGLGSVPVDAVAGGTPTEVLARTDGFWLVRGTGGRIGWLADAAAADAALGTPALNGNSSSAGSR